MKSLKGLYAITPDGYLNTGDLNLSVEQALKGGANILQFRNKMAPYSAQLKTARALSKQCQSEGALFIINDNPMLAAEVGADGVHLGQSDMPLENARALLGPDAIIGITCHNRLDLALKAIRSGADYVAFGRLFCSSTKPNAAAASLEILAAAKHQFITPTAAIGGINASNAAAVIATGADMVAVSSGLFGQTDVYGAACQISALFEMEFQTKEEF